MMFDRRLVGFRMEKLKIGQFHIFRKVKGRWVWGGRWDGEGDGIGAGLLTGRVPFTECSQTHRHTELKTVYPPVSLRSLGGPTPGNQVIDIHFIFHLQIFKEGSSSNFYRAKLRLARYCQGKLSVCPSVTLRYRI